MVFWKYYDDSRLYSWSKGQFEGQMYAKMCNLFLAGEYFSCISEVIQEKKSILREQKAKIGASVLF